jgi:electron transfer flavoprotein-quinone oxidoreductase
MEYDYDVIVIGAGFGGPVAAKLCADAGLKTLILERSKEVGDKVISGLTIPFYGFLFAPPFIRDGNPPFERPSDGIDNYILTDLENEEIIIDDSLKVPKPFSPIIAFGYNTYCKPFCQWLAQKAVDSGAELRTSTTVVDFIKDKNTIQGIITDRGKKIRGKIIINSEGSQGLLAIKAGLRKKYPPESISLADTYDYTLPKNDIDRIFGYSVKMCWGWDEQKAAPPLGYGNGLMVWPYRNSLHFMQDQCLRLDNKKVPNLRKLFDIYHYNITSQLPWWRDVVKPRIDLRARMWEGFEIYIGLHKEIRKQPTVTNGMILIGDVAGLESTELCDGVPAAWFSAEAAAKITIEAIKANEVSREFLKKYETKIRNHPIINWSISGKNRYNLRFAQKEHNLKKLKKYIHNGWGLGSLSYFTSPFLRTLLAYLDKDPTIITKWFKMFFRYYQNWLHENYGVFRTKLNKTSTSKKTRKLEKRFIFWLRFIDVGMKGFKKLKKFLKPFIVLYVRSINTFLKGFLPLFEPIYFAFLKLTKPIRDRKSKKLIEFVNKADPLIFEVYNGGFKKHG